MTPQSTIRLRLWQLGAGNHVHAALDALVDERDEWREKYYAENLNWTTLYEDRKAVVAERNDLAARLAEAERACEKAVRERRSLEVKEDDWHRAYEAAEARVAALTAWATEADELRKAVLDCFGAMSKSEHHMGRDDFAAAERADDEAQRAMERADEIAGNMEPFAALTAADRPEGTHRTCPQRLSFCGALPDEPCPHCDRPEGTGCERHKDDPHNLCPRCWDAEADRPEGDDAMTPDELRAIADAATPGPWEASGTTTLAPSGVVAATGLYLGIADGTREADARLIALAPSLARDHAALLDEREAMAVELAVTRSELEKACRYAPRLAALLDWAANIAHATRRRDQALYIYMRRTGQHWWDRYERYQKRIEVLLAEWDEMQERPS